MKNTLSFIVLFCLCTVMLHAEVRHFNVRDGLASRQVYEIEEDRDGFVWIYTNYGMDRFDGSSMKHYPLTDSEESNDHILSATSMNRSPEGDIWVALKSGVLYRYDRKADAFVKGVVFDGDPDIRLYNFTFAPDSSLIVCSNDGLWRCTEGAAPQPVAMQGVFTDAICTDGAGGFYIGGNSGVYHLPAGASDARLISGSEGMYVKSLAFSSGRLFIGSFNRGVFTLDSPDGRLGRLPFAIPPIPVNAMYDTGNGLILIGVDGAGVYVVDSLTGRLIHHIMDDGAEENSLSSNTVTDILLGSDGGLWIATAHNGLNYIPPFGRSVNVFKDTPGNKASLSSDYVNVIFQDRDGDLWFGTDKGISHYNRATRACRHYLRRDDYVASVVLAVNQDKDGRIWVGTYGEGVSIIDKHSGMVQTFAPGDTTLTEYVFAIAPDSRGNMWIGGINGSMGRYNTSDGSMSYYDEDCVASMTTGPDGTLLFGGNKGVGRYDAANDRFTWTTEFDTVAIRHRYPVRTVTAEPDGTLWIATTGDGLICSRPDGSSRRYTIADGLGSNTIYYAVVDREGLVWIGTETDLYRLDPDTDRITRFTYYLGPDSGAFNPGAAIVADDGTLMLGTAYGCYYFDPQEEFSEAASGNLLLTDFKLHNRPVLPGAQGSPLRQNINLTDKLVLDSNQNSIEVGFALIDYAFPTRVGYEYMLENHDKEYIAAGSAHSARYSDLAPGDYRLHIRAVDRFTGNIMAERTLDMTVRSHILLSWWAKVFYILIFLFLVAIVVRNLRLKAREQRFEAQLHSFAAIAHDIRTPMSLIREPLRNIENTGNLPEAARTDLARVRDGVDRTMGMLSEMLELRRDSAHSASLSVEPCDIREYLKVKAESYRMLAMYKGITINCQVPDDMPEVMIDPAKFDHIADNLISNAIKYTNEGSVTLIAEPLRWHRWRFSVADTGIGIDGNDARYLFRYRHRSDEATACDNSGMGLGLLITRRLVAMHHGSISFKSTPGEGSVFSVTLPVSFGKHFRKVEAGAASDSAEVKTPGGTDAAAESGKSRIFIVEDDAEMLAYLRDSLSADYDVRAFSDPMQVLEDIRHESPDLIISDVMMPRLRGDELCRLIKTDMATSHIPVLLLTGLGGRQDILNGLEARADDYIIKPFDIIVLKARIKNIINSRRELSRRVLAAEGQPEGEDFTNELDREFMEKVLQSVNDHIADSEFSVSELCADLGMSRTSVYNKIKSLTGQSLNEYIRIVRLNKSRELLATRRYNISEVAYMVGFSDPKYFSTCFKKQFGISPSKV
ncbi:MAG: response regulator [Bacteroidales bacterium]|nr:response regulator [Bacteroidales bacterium]